MIVLETNVISEAMKPQVDPAVRAWLNEQAAETLYLTSVTLAEMLFGIAVLPAGWRRNSLTRTLDGLLALFGERVLRSIPRLRAATPRSRLLRVPPAADFRPRMGISLLHAASSLRHVTQHPTRPGGSRSSIRGKAAPALPDPGPEQRAAQGVGTPMDLRRAWARVARAFRPSR
jgi:predicted nucleic acid-binding protein